MRCTLDDLPARHRAQAEEQLGLRPRAQVRLVKGGKTVETGVPASAKYRNVVCVADGHKFHSKKEMRCYLIQKRRVEAGEITNLRLQVKFALFDPGENCRGEHIGTYRADFTWKEAGKLVVADAKSRYTRTLRDWPRTKALMRACHGIEVREL